MSDPIQLPDDTSAGLYVAFKPTNDRLEAGARITTCARCSKIVAHKPMDSLGHEIICLKCACDVPSIAKHIDQLAKVRGE